MKFNATILGSGTSQGIPMIGCDCPVCTSSKLEDKRLRCSVLLEIDGKNFVIDTGPDFRQQMLTHQVKSLEAVLMTHEHKDHIAGLDDVRAFNFLEKRDMQIYCTEAVEYALKREFHYCFSGNDYPGIPRLNIQLIDDEPFEVGDGIVVTPIHVLHYKMPVTGYRIGDFAYITDAKTIDESEYEKLRDLNVLVINALRREEHISHFNLEQALAFISEIKPKKAYLTHISHLFGTHEDILKELPENVLVAYDGLQIECSIQ